MTEIIFVPNSLALVAQLSPHDSSSIQLRQRIGELLTSQQDRPVCIHYAQRAKDFTAHTGSFRAWGAPEVQVSAGNYSPELLGRYLLQQAGHQNAVSVHPIRAAGENRDSKLLVDQDTKEDTTTFTLVNDCLNLVVLDGVAGLTLKAPKYLRPTAESTQQWCVDVLGGQLPSTCLELGELEAAGVDNPLLWPAIYTLRAQGNWQPESVYVDTTHGVARFIATWRQLPTEEHA